MTVILNDNPSYWRKNCTVYPQNDYLILITICQFSYLIVLRKIITPFQTSISDATDDYSIKDFRNSLLFGSFIMFCIQVANWVNTEQFPNIPSLAILQIIFQLVTFGASYRHNWIRQNKDSISLFFTIVYALQIAFSTYLDGFPFEKAAVTLFMLFGFMSLFKDKNSLRLYTAIIIPFDVLLISLKEPATMSQGFAITMTLLFLIFGYSVFTSRLTVWEGIQKREMDLSDSETWFRTIFNSAPIGIVMFNETMQPFKINQHFQNLSGFTEGELLTDDTLIKRIHPDDLIPNEAFSDPTKDVFISKEQRFLHKNEEWLWVEVKISTMHIKKKRFLIVMFSDITKEKKTTDALEKSTEALKRHNEALQEFSYVVSHDLQEPLRMITSFSQIIQKRHSNHFDAASNRDFNFVIDGAKRMSTLIRDMLEYSRWTARDLPLQMVNMTDCKREVSQNLTISIENSGAKLIFDQNISLVANQMMLVQLLQNLVGNAIKYRHPERTPVITIQIQKQQEDWLFLVSDNGMGIEKTAQERIFGIFQRVHADRATGNGIGLAICKRLIERQNGTIWVMSEPNYGSTFYFTLPIFSEKQIKVQKMDIELVTG
jgi:PAS domain S-box-containing protein